MAGETYVGTDDSGRPRYRDSKGKMLPPSFRPATRRRATPSSQIRQQLSSGSADTISGRLGRAASMLADPVRSADSVGGRINQASRRAGAQVGQIGREIGSYNRFLDVATRMNPYGGESPRKRMAPRGGFGRKTGEGFEGYYDEAEFEDPMTGEVRFYPGDAAPILRGMAPEKVVRLQERLHKLGFLSGDYTQGVIRDETRTAFADLLAESNRRGTAWDQTLGDLERMYEELGIDPDEDDGPAPFVRDSYLAPDYATFAQTVKSQMRDSLGRDPDESEMALLVAELSGWDREAFDVEQAAEERMYDAQVSAQEDGTPGLSGGEAQAIDPVARFKESFESRFRGALQFQDDREDTEQSQELTRGAVSTLSQMSGGMG